jgi:cation diffusion facilitator CzcD-associated flavoprotein CzcO
VRVIEFLALTDQCEGLLSNAKLPSVSGIDKFNGHMFHTARWDYEYTGGSPNDANLSSLEGKTVGIVGKSPW